MKDRQSNCTTNKSLNRGCGWGSRLCKSLYYFMLLRRTSYLEVVTWLFCLRRNLFLTCSVVLTDLELSSSLTGLHICLNASSWKWRQMAKSESNHQAHSRTGLMTLPFSPSFPPLCAALCPPASFPGFQFWGGGVFKAMLPGFLCFACAFSWQDILTNPNILSLFLN